MSKEGDNSGIGQNHMGQFQNYLNPQNPAPAAEPKPEVKPDEQPKPSNEDGGDDKPKPEDQPKPNTDPDNKSDKETPKPDAPDTEKPEDTTKPENQNNPKETPKPSEDDLNFQPENKSVELDDSVVLEYLNKKSGKKIDKIDEYFKEQEAVADPMEGLSDDWVQALNFAKETKRPIDDFIKATQDVSKISAIDLARDLTREIDQNLSSAEIDEYLQEELNIDLSKPEEMTGIEKIRLERFVKDYRAQRKAEQEKYSQPVERPDKPEQPKLIDLPNGLKATQEQLDQFTQSRNQYLESLKNSTDKITDSVYQVEIDDNGGKHQLEFGYEYSKDDKHSMVSSASDVEASLQKMFTTDKGLDAASLQEAMFWADPKNRTKAISSIIHKVIAERTEEFAKRRGNVNLGPKGMPAEQKKNGGNTIRIPGAANGQRIPFSLEQFKSN
jgi:ribosomal protein S10